MNRVIYISRKGSRFSWRSRPLLPAGLLLLCGCLYHPEKQIDDYIANATACAFDVEPTSVAAKPLAAKPAPAAPAAPVPAMDVQTTAWMQTKKDDHLEKIRARLKVPEEIPGSEAMPVELPTEKNARAAAIKKLYPPLPPLPAEPQPMPGPDGVPYTLSALQQLAAGNSPALQQAAADVEAAKGALIQANTYPNPTVGITNQPNNANTAPGSWGPFIDQVIKTGGKMKLQTAAAEMDLRNAELALKKARNDLATSVRNAYYGFLVAREAVRVTKAVARFTDEIYRIQAELLESGFAAPYEPAALRAQAFAARLAFTQAIATYVYAWKQLVATVGLAQLPLAEVAGRIDRLVPRYEYDDVLAHVLQNHTDVLTARKVVEKAKYNLKLAQVLPYCPDVEINTGVNKDLTLPPHGTYVYATIGAPLPIWDKNKGNIISAEAALRRASEESHRVEITLTNSLAGAFTGYKNNLEALAYYRRYILPDQVRAYRGVFERRGIDLSVAFADLVTAQQNLTNSVTNYLSILGQLWTSAIAVADLLQTDDLFQLGTPHEVPELPNLDRLPHWFCQHPCLPAPLATASETLPLPRTLPAAKP